MTSTPIPLTVDGTGPDGAIPVSISGLDGGSSTVEWADVSGKPSTYPPTIGTTDTTAKAGNYQPSASNISDASAVGRSVLTAADASAARTAIGAGTSNLAIGTTATTAKAGNYVPAWGDVTGKPATFPPVVGTGATDAKAGNYQPTWAQVTAKPATVAALPATLGTAGQVLAVNAEGTGLEWIDLA